jgi:hypothetical protein
MCSWVMLPAPRARSGAQRRHCAGTQWDARRCAHRVGAASGRHPAFVAHVGRHRPLHSGQAGLAERLDEVAVWVEPHLVATVDGVYLGNSHRRQCQSAPAGHYRSAAAREVDPRSPGQCPSRHLLSDSPNAGQRRRRPAFDAAAMLFARRPSRIQHAIVEIGEASSGFIQFVAMASMSAAATSAPWAAIVQPLAQSGFRVMARSPTSWASGMLKIDRPVGRPVCPGAPINAMSFVLITSLN